MSLVTNITSTDNATPELIALMRRLQPRRLFVLIGVGVVKLFKQHFKQLAPNRRGWKSTRFWERAARATRWEVAGSGVAIIVDLIGVNQRFYGGTITAKNVKNLTIPVNSEAYGKTAKDFENLVLVKTRKGAYLAESTMERTGTLTSGKRTRRGRNNVMDRQRLTFMFKLVPSVSQDADPNIIPSPEDITNAITHEVAQTINP